MNSEISSVRRLGLRRPVPVAFVPAIFVLVVLATALVAMAGPNVPLGGRRGPTVTVNPTNPLNLAYATMLELRVTTDGGSTWQEPVFPVFPPEVAWDGPNSSVEFDANDRLFWAYRGVQVGQQYPDIGPGADIFVAQCDPATGAVLPGYPVNVTEAIGEPGSEGFRSDTQWFAVDNGLGSPFAGRLYLVWMLFPPGAPSRTMTSWSADRGMSWSPPVQLGLGSTVWLPHITVAPNGDVYVAEHWGLATGVSGRVRLYRSTDGGASFPQSSMPFLSGQADVTWNQQTGAPIPGADFHLLGNMHAWVLADPNVAGRIYVIADDDPDNDLHAGDAANVYIAISTDYGVTWAPPARVDHGPGTTFQVMPAASIDPGSGTIAVDYYDNRNGALNSKGNFLLDVFVSVSTDGGATFGPDFQINDLSFDPDLGPKCEADCGPFIGDVWAGAEGKAFAVAWSGDFLIYDGSIWDTLSTTATRKYAVWGASNSDVFVCGDGGEILHYDGAQLSPQTSNTTSDLFGIDGRSGSDVFAVGAGGTVVHYDGTSWSPLESGTTEELHDVWVNPTGSVFAVGRHGTVLRYDGMAWSNMPTGTSTFYLGLWGSADDDLYAVGNTSSILHWNGTAWADTLEGSGLAVMGAVWGSSPTDLITLGWGFGGIRRYDGLDWWMEDPTEISLLKVDGTGHDNVFVVGEYASIAHYDGSSWTMQDNPLTTSLPTVGIGHYNGMSSAGDRAFAVWCGNDFRSQQAIFGTFDTGPSGITLFDPTHVVTALEFETPKPNPASGSTRLAYSLPRSETVDLAMIDVGGRCVATLVHGRQPAGRHVLSWDGRDAAGGKVAAGVYFLRLTAGQETSAQRLTVVP